MENYRFCLLSQRRGNRLLILRFFVCIQHELVWIQAFTLFQIGDQCSVVEIEFFGLVPIVLRNFLEPCDDVMIVSFDREFASRIEAPRREIDRADDRAFAVGQHHLGVHLQMMRRVHLNADVLQNPQTTNAFDELVGFQRVRLFGQDMHFDAARPPRAPAVR